MKFYSIFLIGFILLIVLSACDSPKGQQQLKTAPDLKGKKDKKNTKNKGVDSLNSRIFTSANTTGNFSKGQGSEKKKSTEKPNRKRVSHDFTHPFQTPVEFVDESSDPAFNYSSPNECEIILADSLP